jgi:hypothetical protein
MIAAPAQYRPVAGSVATRCLLDTSEPLPDYLCSWGRRCALQLFCLFEASCFVLPSSWGLEALPPCSAQQLPSWRSSAVPLMHECSCAASAMQHARSPPAAHPDWGAHGMTCRPPAGLNASSISGPAAPECSAEGAHPSCKPLPVPSAGMQRHAGVPLLADSCVRAQPAAQGHSSRHAGTGCSTFWNPSAST